jgi:hypothetical protein
VTPGIDASSLRAAADRLSAVSADRAARELSPVADAALRLIRDAVPERTGHLRASLRSVPARPEGREVGRFEVGSDLPETARDARGRFARVSGQTALAVLEYGSAPHVIEGARGFVRITTRAGEARFLRAVRHPGTRPLGMFRRALDALSPEADAAADRMADAVLRAASGG